MVPQPGSTPVPGFSLTQRLGSGAFGDVWEAAAGDGRRVALKFLDCRKRAPAMVAAEVRVLRGLTSLQHPHIIPLLGVTAWGQYIVLCMERADRNLEDLRLSHVQHNGSNIPPAEALDLLDQAAAALDFIAEPRNSGMTGSRGMQHCDVKPTNLLLVGGQLKVADFGLCAGTGWQTHQGGWRGTVPFAAPELYRGAAAPGTDQFALAVTFCAAVMGERVFYPAESRPTGTPVDLTKLRTHEFPVIARALNPHPSSRFPSCRDFVAELRRVIERARPSKRVPTVRRSGLLRRAAALQALKKTK